MAKYQPDENKLSMLEKKHGLPPGLLKAVIRTESNFNPNAVSPVGAAGIMQFMPDTAKQYGVDRFDPESSIQGGAKMLGELNKKYGGDINKVAAAYNWGQGNVDRKGLDRAPVETRSYMDKIGKLLNPIGNAQASEEPYIPTREEFMAMEQSMTPKPDKIPTREEFMAMEQDNQKPQYEGRNIEDMSGISKFLTGVGNSVLDLGRGAAQITGLAGDTGFGSKKDIESSRALSSELGKYGAGMAGNIVGAMAPALVTGGTSLPAVVATSAGISALQPTVDDESRLKNAAMGAAGGAIGKGVAAGLGKVVKGFTPSADAKALMDKGIQPTVGQGIKQGALGKGIRKAEEATNSLPFLGAITKHARDRTIKEGMSKAIATAEDKTLGVSAKGALGHEAINNLKSTFNEAYTNVMAGHAIPINNSFIRGVHNAINDQTRFLNDTERTTITNGVQALLSKIQPQADGRYLASDLHKVESALKTQSRALPYGDERARVLSDIKNVISQYRTANLPADVGKKIKQLDSKYLNFTRLRRAAEGVGAEHGEFSPAQLYNAATMMGKKSGQSATGRAPLQELSGQLKAVASDKLGDSGTAGRLLTNKLLLGGALEGAAAYANPLQSAILGAGMFAGSARPVQKALLGGYGGQAVASKNINKLARSLGLVVSDKAIKKSQKENK